MHDKTPISPLAAIAILALAAQGALGADAETWAAYGQFTNVSQFHPRYRSPYAGPNSLDPGNNTRETVDATLFAGARLWDGAQAWLNPEIDQGFGFNDTLGVAGFTSGEAYKVGANRPYYRLPRAFVRQVIGLGGDEQAIDAAPNQLASTTRADSLTLTVGKFSVVDVFDANRYAHDPRGDFLNWSVIEAGAFDYAADAWGYTLGAAAEWSCSDWTLRGGVFDLSRVPNSKELERGFGQFAVIGEVEHRTELGAGRPGKVRLLGYLNRGRMARYDDAVAEPGVPATPPDPARVRRYASRPGAAVNVEQQLAPDLGAFARASINDGSKEAYDFTDINRSLSGGLSLQGARWERAADTVGVAFAINRLSDAAKRYFAAGGVGILVGDGQLPHYGDERILEAYYAARVLPHAVVTADLQFIDHPAYNRDRGPLPVVGLRFHAEF